VKTSQEGYESLLERVLGAVEDGDLPTARRHLVQARARADDDQLRGAIAALDLVCAPADDDDGQLQQLQALAARTADQAMIFANAVGCTLSDVGERTDDGSPLPDPRAQAAGSRMPVQFHVRLDALHDERAAKQ